MIYLSMTLLFASLLMNVVILILFQYRYIRYLKMDKLKEELLADLPADIQNYMRKLAEMDLFMTGKTYNF